MVDADGFSLCGMCARRQGDSEGRAVSKEEPCFICQGLTAELPSIERKVLRESKKYQYETFSVGIILPAGAQEREDQLRSQLKIRGRPTMKSQFAGSIIDFIRAESTKEVDRLHPDLTIVVDVGKGTTILTAKSVFVYGRYTKPRGVSQRKDVCESCDGRGCDNCEGGYARTPSLEALVDRKLSRLMGAQKAKFTWFGSEDPDSMVYPPGRPFVVEVKSPRKRQISTRMALVTGKGMARLSGLRVLRGKPSSIPGFTFKTRVFVESSTAIDRSLLKSKEMRKGILVDYRNNKDKVVHKKVYWLRARVKGRKMVAEIKLDGGLPVKRFVSGESVSPSLSELLKTPLNCQRFDILRVWETGDLEFGKI